MSKAQKAPHSTCLSGPHWMSGGCVSRTVTVWLQKAELLDVSVTRQVRVTLNKAGHLGLRTLVTVETTSITRLNPSISSAAVGISNAQSSPASTDLSSPHVMFGGFVSAAFVGKTPKVLDNTSAETASALNANFMAWLESQSGCRTTSFRKCRSRARCESRPPRLEKPDSLPWPPLR